MFLFVSKFRYDKFEVTKGSTIIVILVDLSTLSKQDEHFSLNSNINLFLIAK